MIETDLFLAPNEASDLCRVFPAEVLERHGWDRALVTVLDEAPAEEAIALLVHRAGAALEADWEARRIHARPVRGGGRTEDAEACARRDGFVYVVGSQFGKKAGPLAARRSWMARVSETSLESAATGGRADIELARLRFSLHRAVNDALASAAVELIALGPVAREAYIDATIARGAEKGKRWAGRVTSADHPINVEAAEFRADGRMLLGLRYPVTADGRPLLVELLDVDALFEAPEEARCGAVWWLEDAGSRQAPVGFRALDGFGDDTFHAVVGNLDAADKSATVLEDHPEGGEACSEHRSFALPLTAGGGPVASEVVHRFGDVRRVEGLALDGDGHVHYVIDEEERVALRTLSMP